VTLLDRFGALSVKIRKVERLCNPADADATDPSAPDADDHLARYKVQGARFTPRQNLTVTNEFGTLAVDVARPDRVLVPSATSVVAPPTFLPDGTDHFDCYQVRRARNAPAFEPIRGIALDDEFGSGTADVGRPRRLCAPAVVNGVTVGAPDHLQHLMCYKVHRSPRFSAGQAVFVTNELADHELRVTRPVELCVPSVVSP
jgi:hypothetical protein